MYKIIEILYKKDVKETIIPLNIKNMNIARKIVKELNQMWIVIKEVEEETVTSYLYSCSQLINKDTSIIIFLETLLNLDNEMDIIRRTLELPMNKKDYIVLLKTNRKIKNTYRAKIQNNYILRIYKEDKKGEYYLTGIMRLGPKFFHWLNEREGIDPHLTYKDLDDVFNQYIYEGNNIYAYVI